MSLTVENLGPITGSEVVQLYVSYPDTGITHPLLQLKGFAKAHDVAPESGRQVSLNLDKYAVSFWDSTKNAWRVVAGKYAIHVGFNCDHIVMTEEFEVKQGFLWTEL